MQSLSCPVCYSDLDQGEHLPRVIPSCGHTICTTCLSVILEDYGDLRCPLDKVKFATTKKEITISGFPVNYSLINVLEGTSERGLCEEHDEEFRFICHTDRRKLCDVCVCSVNHRGHEVTALKKLKVETDKKKKQLENVLEDLDMGYKEISEGLQKKQGDVLGVVRNTFDEIKNSLKNKEEQLNIEIKSFFQVKTEKASQLYGKKSLIRDQISENLNQLKFMFQKDDILFRNDFLSNIQANIQKFESEIQPEVVHKNSQQLFEGLRDISSSLQSALTSHTKPCLQFDFSFEDFLKNIPEEEEVKENANISAKSSIGFDCKDNYLEISIQQGAPKEITLNVDEWRKVQVVTINIKPCSLNKEDIKVLQYVWQKLTGMVHLIMKPTSDYVSEDLMTSVARALDKPTRLQKLELDFRLCSKVSDQNINALMEHVFSESIYLKSLQLYLHAPEISNSSMESLAENLLSKAKRLEEFTLDLKRTRVNDRGFTHVFKSLAPVKSLSLQLNLSKVGDKSIEVLAKKLLPSIDELENFELNLHSTQVTDFGLEKLFNSLKSAQKIVFDLRSTKISDRTVDPFLKKKLPTFKNLKEFKMEAANTNVGYDTRVQIDELQNKFISQ